MTRMQPTLKGLAALAFLAALAGPAAAQTVKPFPADRVERAKAMFQANATSGSPMDCITTLNYVMSNGFLEDPLLELGSQIDHTFAKLQSAGHATAPKVIEFFDERGKATTGVTAPKTLRESAFDNLKRMAGNTPGWHVFGLSLMDGYHSVTLVLDLNDASAPKVFWADQWSTKGGWLQYDKAGLDGEIERLTGNWWTDTKKPRSRTTLWRVISTTQSRVAISTGSINVRAEPSAAAAVVARTTPGAKNRLLERQGSWIKIELANGTQGWVSAPLVRTARATMPPRTSTTTTPTTGLTGAVPTQ